MAPNVQVLNKQLAMINNFLLDCLLSDNHTFAAEVTKFPVESGGTITDNIRNEPLVVVMDCLVSNTPIGQLVDLRDKVNEPADAAYDMLLKVRSDRLPVTIRTSLRTYSNMALSNLTIPRASGRGDELRFTATFQEIEIVVNKRGTRVAIPGAKSHASFSGTTAQLAIQFQALAPAQLASFGFHPDTVNGQIGLAVTKLQAAQLANSAELDRPAASRQNLGQRVTFGKPTADNSGVDNPVPALPGF